MVRSCRVGKCYAPLPIGDEGKENDTQRFYEHYLVQDTNTRRPFMSYCRLYKWQKRKNKPGSVVKLHAMGKDTIAMGVRFQNEQRDNYLGQLGTMFLPHLARSDLLAPDSDDSFRYVRCLRGLLFYLRGLVQSDDDDDDVAEGAYLSACSVRERDFHVYLS